MGRDASPRRPRTARRAVPALVAAFALLVAIVGVWTWTRTPDHVETVGASSLATAPDKSRASSLPPQPGDAALIDLLAIADPQKRVAALHAWFRANLPSRLAELQRFFSRMHEQTNPDLFTAFQVFLEEWGALDGAAAHRFLEQAPPGSGLDAYAEFVIRGWLRSDFDGLWRFVQLRRGCIGPSTDEDAAQWAVTYFTEAFLDADADRFFAWAETAQRQTPPDLWRELVRTTAFHANDATIDRIADWLRQNDAQLDARDLLDEFARRYAESKPQQAAAWAIALPRPEQRGAAAVVIARRLATQDFALGVEWLARPDVFQALRSAQAEWRAGEKPASAYDAAVAEYLSTLARHHGDDPRILDAAQASMSTVQDAEVRRHLAERIDEVRVTYFGRPVR